MRLPPFRDISGQHQRPARIAWVEPFLSPAGEEMSILDVMHRDVEVIHHLRQLGHHVVAFQASCATQAFEVQDRRGGVWRHHPIDEAVATMASPPPSESLIADVIDWQPDFALVRGAATPLGRELTSAYDGPIGVVLGGRHKTSSLCEADLVLTEEPDQEAYLRRRIGRSRLLRLPKLPAPGFITEDVVPTRLRPYDVVVVSAFKPHKNHAALRPLLELELRVALIGDGPLRSQFEQSIRSCRANVHFTGNTSLDHVAHIVGNAKLLVHPSLSEGFPRAVAEAFALGTVPVVLKGVVGYPVQDGYNGVVTTEGELRTVVEQLLDNAELTDALSRQAMRTHQENFSQDALSATCATLDARIRSLLDDREPMVARARPSNRMRRSVWNATTRLAPYARRLVSLARARRTVGA